MKLHDIHTSPEERLANNSNATLSAIQEMHKTMKDMASEDKMGETNKLLQEIKDKEIPEYPKPATEMAVTIKGISVLTLKGDKGDTPVKGKDYFDGLDGRTPIFIGNTEPQNPQKGDIWYQD